MIRLLGGRGASALFGFLMLALASSPAAAQAIGTPAVSQSGAAFDLAAVVRTVAIDTSAKPLGTPKATPATPLATPGHATAPAAQPVGLVQSVTLPVQRAVATVTRAIVQAQPAPTMALSLAPAIAREAGWLLRGGWPLYALVDRYGAGAPLDEQANCMAVAIYHEARGESLEGQLAVARVIMNRAASGKYPPSWCGTVKQPWQFSFVNPRTGHMPGVNASSAAWRKAQAITRLAISNVVPSLSNDVLWYHADYVAPSWGRRLSVVQKIGTHIFYRS